MESALLADAASSSAEYTSLGLSGEATAVGDSAEGKNSGGKENVAEAEAKERELRDYSSTGGELTSFDDFGIGAPLRMTEEEEEAEDGRMLLAAEGMERGGLTVALDAVEVQSNSCFFRFCVLRCSDVAASQAIVKVVRQDLVRFPTSLIRRVSPQFLTTLDLSWNQIRSVPSYIAEMNLLTSVNLSHNLLRRVNGALFKLPLLEQLDLSHNHISFLEPDVLKLKQLKILDVKENPIGWPPKDVAASGGVMLRRWAKRFSQLRTHRVFFKDSLNGELGEVPFLDVTYCTKYDTITDEKDEDRSTEFAVEAPAPVSEYLPTHSSVLRPTKAFFWGIYDGHSGDRVAIALKEHFHKKFEEEGLLSSPMSDSEIRRRIKQLYLDADDKICLKLKQEKGRRRRKAGSCCTTVLLRGRKLVVAHVGDSRVILVKKNGDVVELAPDHHPNVEEEKRRVEERGGIITFRGCWRVYSPEEGMYLAVSRAFGDIALKYPKKVIDADPDVCIRTLQEDDAWLIIASDGLWCRVQNHLAADLVRGRASAQHATAALMFEAKRRRTHDNTTITTVKLDWGHIDTFPDNFSE